MLSPEVKKIFEKYNGTLPTKIAVQHGINRETLRKAALRNDIEKVGRGIYLLHDAIEDDLFSTQAIYNRGIYSHETALMLYNYGTFSPFKHHMTFPQGYNSKVFKDSKIKPTFVSKKYYDLGVTQVDTWFGNPVNVYDRERTVLDMLVSPTALAFTLEEMWRDYLDDDEKDLDMLKEYARLLNREYALEGIDVIGIK